MRSRIVTVNDKMQQGYCYEVSAPAGRAFDRQFRPDLTPKQMLELGVFCGKYLTDCRDEFPASWFARAKLSLSGRDCSLNYFGVDASQPLSEWRRKRWIHRDDPRGWFQWYCRYYLGRRMPEEDSRQIGRWKAMQRHVGQIRKHCEPGDQTCRRRQRQALLHWRMTAGECRGRIVGSNAVARHLGAFGCPSGRERCGGVKSGGTTRYLEKARLKVDQHVPRGSRQGVIAISLG